eukprot:CAMPEP_0195289208 /NCGR_PEP_ID=MMETSP0707-20130614/5583_1 /TAXON_ID=33640 /ORGANISM="Asterionellopsis glacialis, Strain CCMP134" /LENGTH=60 /DNA_ID=CAMNT_0040349185 /DNA_START=78 /DNA_END=257 /DNA_ORIENTATION=+
MALAMLVEEGRFWVVESASKFLPDEITREVNEFLRFSIPERGGAPPVDTGVGPDWGRSFS